MAFDKLDLRLSLILGLIVVVIIVTIVGDVYTFTKEPTRIDEKLLTIPASIGYQLLGDRWGAAAFSFAVYLTIFGLGGFGAYWVFIVHILEPWEMNRFWRHRGRRAVHAERKRFGG